MVISDYEEMPAEEKKELELTEFLREFATKVNRKFETQENSISDIRRDVVRLEEKIFLLENRIEEVAEREKRISRDILAIID